MSLFNLSATYENMRAFNVKLQEALTDAQMAAGIGRLALKSEMAKRDRAEATLIVAVRRMKAAEGELDELKDLLMQATILRDIAAVEWLVAVAEERAATHARSAPTVPAAASSCGGAEAAA